MSQQYPLDLTGDEMHRLVEAAMERIAGHVDSLPEQPASHTAGGARLARSLAEPVLPESGTPVPKLLDLLFDRAVPRSINTAGPGYLAYVPGGGLLHAAVADLISDSVNRYVGLFGAAPGLAQIEMNVLDWFREMVGFPPEAGGILTSGGSLSALTALITARRERLPENFLSGVIYVSDQAHHSLQKAALLAGFPAANVRKLPTDDRFRLRPETLDAAVEDDRRRGLTPFLAVASAGTTNTGAVDPLDELAEAARRHGLWLHVDAAYGGFFLLTGEGRRILRGIERADSVVLDPHKGLFLPYGTGALLVRDAGALRRTHSLAADYLPSSQEGVDFCEISPELTRPFRGLRVWLPLKMHGAGAFREALEEKLALARWASEELKKIEGVEILAEPQLSTLAFRLNPGGLPTKTTEELNLLNRRFMKRINDRKRVLLTGTLLRGEFVIRICVLSFRTHKDRMILCLDDIRKEAA